jgi:carbamoyl-phosphate synthase large subunit
MTIIKPGKPRITMLLSSAGRRVELLVAFREAAAELGIGLTIIASDLTPEWSAACSSADRFVKTPRADSPEFVPSMLSICREFGVQLVVPTIDTELQALSEAAGEFRALGCRIAVSAPDFVAMARDKLLTAQQLAAAGVPTPLTATVDEVRANPEAWQWPLIVKPRHGSAGRAISIAATAADLPQTGAEPFIAQQLLSGDEYTINMFVDAGGKAQCVIPHRRVQTRAGEVEKGITERRPDLCDIGWLIADRFRGIQGVICFQAIVTETGPAVFEINARFGGGYPLAHQAGARCAQWLLEEAAALPCSANDGWREDVKMLRYDAAVFEGHA